MSFRKPRDRDDQRYVDGLIAVSVDALEPRQREDLGRQARERAGGNPASSARLREEFGTDSAAVARVTGSVEILEVDDPESAASQFDDDPRVSASPIQALGFNWHVPLTATKPEEPKSPVAFTQLPPANRQRVIATVDTGIVDVSALPGWMSSSIIHGEGDIEVLDDDDPGHGTFVASLLRQIAPTHGLSVARADTYDEGEPRADSHPAPEPTTEFHVADAIHRLIERHRGNPSIVEALNLSVGGPAISRSVMVTVRSAIARWREVFPKTPVFAAAGNSPETVEIFPAAFRYARGVAAANHEGDQIVWDSHGSEVEPNPPERQWVDDVAPGSNLIGLGGRAPDDVIKWSGSSFATAVATASYVNGGPLEVRDGLSYWPARTMGYGEVPGLKFE